MLNAVVGESVTNSLQLHFFFKVALELLQGEVRLVTLKKENRIVKKGVVAAVRDILEDRLEGGLIVVFIPT